MKDVAANASFVYPPFGLVPVSAEVSIGFGKFIVEKQKCEQILHTLM